MAAKPLPLPIFDRKAGKLLDEFMDDSPATYESEPDRSLIQWLESQPLFDWLLAANQNMPWSARKIKPFIRKHHINMKEFEPVHYRSYAEFFDRKFKPGQRTFPKAVREMGAFGEGRYFGWEKVDSKRRFPIKGSSMRADQLLNNAERAKPFVGGPVIMARLAPVDYHHLHYPDDGETLEHERCGGRLWTVNWHALQNKPDILLRNERQVNIWQTKHFGRIGFVEIGALSVGRIVQVHPHDKSFKRGEEKSAFRFGGSAVVMFGEKGAWSPSDDILKNTSENIETMIRLGETIAHRAPK